MTTTERAVRKASRERLLRDMQLAAETMRAALYLGADRESWLFAAQHETSRTRYACLMTAFGL